MQNPLPWSHDVQITLEDNKTDTGQEGQCQSKLNYGAALTQ